MRPPPAEQRRSGEHSSSRATPTGRQRSVLSMALLHTLDEVILIVFLLVSLSVSIHQRLKRWRAGPGCGTRHGLAVFLTALTTFLSPIFVLGTTAEVYYHGSQWLVATLAGFIATLVVAFVFVPVFYKLRLTSLCEYLGLRYDDRLAPGLGALALAVHELLLGSLLVHAAAELVSVVSGVSAGVSLSLAAAAVVGYSLLLQGHPQDSTKSDVVLSLIVFLGLLAVVALGAGSLGGVAKLLQISRTHDRTNVFDFTVDVFQRSNFWNILLGASTLWTAWMLLSEPVLERCLRQPSGTRAKLTVLATLPALLTSVPVCVLAGLAVSARWPICSRPDRLLARWAAERLGQLPGTAGVLLAALLAAALTAAAAASARLARLCWRQLLRHRALCAGRPGACERWTRRLLKVLFGIVCACLAFVTGSLGGLLQAYVAVCGAALGPVLGLLSLGALVPFSNKQGAFTGYLVGLILALWTAFGSRDTGPTLAAAAAGCGDLLANDSLSSDHSRSPVNLNLTNDSRPLANLNLTNDSRLPVSLNLTNVSLSLSDAAPTDNSQHGPNSDSGTGVRRRFALSFMLSGPVGAVVTVVVGTLVSIITGGQKPYLRLDTVSPLVLWMLPAEKLEFYREQSLCLNEEEAENDESLEMGDMEVDKEEEESQSLQDGFMEDHADLEEMSSTTV